MSDPLSPEHHYVYMARCANGSLYTGYSKQVEARIAAHNAGKGGRYTRAHRPVELVACWSFRTKKEALQVEYQIKQLPRKQKLALLASSDLPEWLTCLIHRRESTPSQTGIDCTISPAETAQEHLHKKARSHRAFRQS